MKLRLALAALLLGTAPAAAQQAIPIGETAQAVTFAAGLDHPWGLAFLPDGRALVTERAGNLRLVAPDGTVSPPLRGLPKVADQGQGGLLDVAIDPDFQRNRMIYLSFAEPAEGGARTAVMRGRLDTGRLNNVQVIFRQQPAASGGRHFGSRLVFDETGHLFVTTGDRGDDDLAQDLTTHMGKLIRILPDGSVPDDNPFVGRADAKPEIFSYGHRNMQGAALHPQTGEIWIHEHGPRGGDEVNRPEMGKNYGWPIVTHGRAYSGLPIGEGKSAPGLEDPLHVWVPSIAPSGMAFYDGKLFEAWQGDLFVGGLVGQMLVRLDMQDGQIAGEERFPLDIRIRDVRQGPGGHLYLLEDDSPGRILRLEPRS